MAVYNYAGGEVNIKIVYYGPGLSGKTTNLEHMYSKLPRENKGKMVSMKTRTDRTLFFDFLPIEVDGLNGMTARFLLYTVPGQVYYNATRKLVLKGADAVVFVADSDPERMDDNRESLSNLEENLNELGLSLSDVPWVIQYNKRDLPDRMDREALDAALNHLNVTAYEAVATTGQGVYETFEGIARKVFRSLNEAMKNPAAAPQNEDKPASVEVRAEVVSKGKKGVYDSETDKSESLCYAEEREEEHESVSELIENVLSDGEKKDSIDMNSTREGYEDYGHMVELGNGAASPDPGKAAAEESPDGNPAGLDIINDPLEKLCECPPADDGGESMAAEPRKEEASAGAVACMVAEKRLTVALELSEEEIRGNVPIRIILDIKVASS